MTSSSTHPLLPGRDVDPGQDLVAMEHDVLDRWREREVFEQSLTRRQDAPRWVFYEGPPTANGPPGAHHVLSRAFKDIYPRYKTMRGYRVDRKGGWDCHGLPVEIAVEQQLGFQSKSEIEDYGIEEFNRRCRDSVFTHLAEWDRLTERIGFWVDLEHAYRTLDEDYIESVWWALSEIDRRGLLYEGHRVVPYCVRCGTALSSHEVALGYRDVVDPSVYVQLALLDPAGTQAIGDERPPRGADGHAGDDATGTAQPAGRSPVAEGDLLLVWTTTPWTLPANVALAVGPQIAYVRARVGAGAVGDAPTRATAPTDRPEDVTGVSGRGGPGPQAADGAVYILAESLVESVLGPAAEILDRFPGSDLVGCSYGGPIFDTGQPGALPIVAGDFVTTDDGTGIVHIAPAFGEDDFAVAAENRIGGFDPTVPASLFNPVRPDGTFDQRVADHDGRSFQGRRVKGPGPDNEDGNALNEDLIAALARRGLLFRRVAYEHSYPHCWRCGTPLIYYARTSWYIRTTAVREELLQANETVSWHPSHVKHGRFGDWLSNNVDWAISRERYWGTPLPVWRCPEGHTHMIGSFAELAERSGKVIADHHRPHVDDVEIACPHRASPMSETGPAGDVTTAAADVTIGAGTDADGPACGLPMVRVPEVIDVWFDSGSMPFAQHHHPFEHQDDFAAHFPADFICEAQDQTRGWFYSLLAISTLLGRPAPYRNVVCLGLILDEEGQKMSKSRGNTVEPFQVLDSYGADALRWYFFTAKAPWDGYRFSAQTISEGVRLFLKQLWSTYYFYVLYAQVNADALTGGAVPDAPPSRPAGSGDPIPGAASATGDPVAGAPPSSHDLDRWALSRTAATAELVAERLDAYDTTTSGRAIAALVDDLSNWYVRRSRRRFWDGDPDAFQTLHTCLVTVAKLLAPFCPFIADEIYENLDGALPSVHLADFPTAASLPRRDRDLEEAMAIARETVRLGLGARGRSQIKVRQPLSEAVIVADRREREAIERLGEIVREELNVRRLRFVAEAGELGDYEVKANYRTLGPTFGRAMPSAADAIAALDPAHVARAVREGTPIGISIDGHDHSLTADDVILTMRPPEGYSVEREGSHAVALDLTIDDDLLAEGRAREIVHAVQNARKSAGLQVEDRIDLSLAGDHLLVGAASAHERYVTRETLATTISHGGGDRIPDPDHDGLRAAPDNPEAARDSARTAHDETTSAPEDPVAPSGWATIAVTVDDLPLTISLRRVERR